MAPPGDGPLSRRRALARDVAALLLLLAGLAALPSFPAGPIDGAWLGVARTDDPGREDLRTLRERFGAGDTVALLLQGEAPGPEEAAGAIARAVSPWPEVASVVGPRRGYAPRNLLAEDRRAAVVYVETRPEVAGAAMRDVVDRLKALPVPAGTTLAVGGSVVEEIVLAEAVERDRRVVVPLVFAVLALLGWWMLGSLSGAAALTASLLLSLVLTMGAYGAIFGSVTTVTTSLVLVVLPVAAANLSHVAIGFQRHRRRLGPAEAADAAVRHGHRGCLLATSTTAVAFLSAITMRIPEFERLAVGGAIGCVVAYLVTVGFLPALLARDRGVSRRRRPVGAPLTMLAVRDLRARGPLAPLLLGLVLVLGLGAVRLEPESKLLRELPRRSQAREVTRVLDEKLGGSSHLYAVWTSPRGWRDAAGLERLAAAEREVEARVPRVRAATGAGTVVDRLLSTPLGKNGRRAVLGVLESGLLGRLPRWIDAEGTHARIAVQFPGLTTREYLDGAAAIEGVLRPLARPGERVAVTGPVLLIARSAEAVVAGGATSFLVSMLVVSAIGAFALRSWRAMPLLWVPNLLPLLGVVGVLGWTATPLSFSTAIVGSIVLGMTSDDTIHFLVRAEREPRRVAHVLASLGPAFIGTTTVLVAGAAVASLGEARPVALFSRLMAVGVGLALGCDLFVTPRLHRWLHRAPRGGRSP